MFRRLLLIVALAMLVSGSLGAAPKMLWNQIGTGGPFPTNFDVGGHKLINGSAPLNETDVALKATVTAANTSMKAYVDAHTSSDSTKLNKSGDNWTGDQSAGGHRLINVGAPVNESDAALKSTVTTANASLKSHVDANDTLLHAYAALRLPIAAADSMNTTILAKINKSGDIWTGDQDADGFNLTNVKNYQPGVYEMVIDSPTTSLVTLHADNGTLIQSVSGTLTDADKVTAVTELIQYAMNNSNSIFLKRGTLGSYRVNDSLVRFQPTDGIRFTFHSDGAQLFWNPFRSTKTTDIYAKQQGMFIFGDYDNNVQGATNNTYIYNGVDISGIRFDINGQNQPVQDQLEYPCLYIDRVFDPVVTNCEFKNSPCMGFVGYRYMQGGTFYERDYAVNLLVDHCSALNCGFDANGEGINPTVYSGFFISDRHMKSTVRDSVARGCYNGFELEDGTRGSTITGCTARNNTAAGIRVQNVYLGEVSHNLVYGNNEGITTSTDSRYLTASNNIVFLNANYGMNLTGSDRSIISNNMIYNNGNAGLVINYNCNINGNNIYNNGINTSKTDRVGVLILASGGYNMFTGNIIANDAATSGSGKQLNAVDDLASVGYNYWDNNRIAGISGGTDAFEHGPSVSSKFGINSGFVARFDGTATLLSGTTSLAITHGLSVAPNRYTISFTSDPKGKFYWVSSYGATTMTLNASADPGANVGLCWEAWHKY